MKFVLPTSLPISILDADLPKAMEVATVLKRLALLTVVLKSPPVMVKSPSTKVLRLRMLKTLPSILDPAMIVLAFPPKFMVLELVLNRSVVSPVESISDVAKTLRPIRNCPFTFRLFLKYEVLVVEPISTVVDDAPIYRLITLVGNKLKNAPPVLILVKVAVSGTSNSNTFLSVNFLEATASTANSTFPFIELKTRLDFPETPVPVPVDDTTLSMILILSILISPPTVKFLLTNTLLLKVANPLGPPILTLAAAPPKFSSSTLVLSKLKLVLVDVIAPPFALIFFCKVRSLLNKVAPVGEPMLTVVVAPPILIVWTPLSAILIELLLLTILPRTLMSPLTSKVLMGVD